MQPTIPLHPAQLEVFKAQLIDLDNPFYNVGGYITLKGRLVKEKLMEAIRSAPETFDVFRMKFYIDESQTACFLESDDAVMELAELDFSHHSQPEQKAKDWMQQRFNVAFFLTSEKQLFETVLIKIATDEHWLFMRYHHLVIDGYGFIVWSQYLARKYGLLLTGDVTQLCYPLYATEVNKANEYKKSAFYRQDSDYWKDKLSETPKKILPRRYNNQPHGKSSTFNFELPDTVRNRLETLQTETQTSLQQLTIAALLIYFGKTTGVPDLVFGIPLHKRDSRQMRNVVGMFASLLPFKGCFRPETRLLDFLKELTQAQKKDYRYKNFFFDDLSTHLHFDSLQESFYEIVVNYEPLNFELNFSDELQATVEKLVSEYERIPLQLCWLNFGHHQPLKLQLIFREDYFTQQEMALFTRRLLFILEQFPLRVEEAIENIDLIPPEERQLLHAFNDTGTDDACATTPVALFEQQVIKTPGNTALIFEEQLLTYRQLNEKANQLAHYLREKGIGQEARVPVCLERSLEMVIAVLAILKAGATYVPIDPAFPAERIQYILEDTKATVVLTSSLGQSWLPEGENAEYIIIDKEWPLIAGQPTCNLQTRLSPAALVYVIYTSGSTGKPKGVEMPGSNLVNLLRWQEQQFNNAQRHVLQFASLNFDVSFQEIFSTLCFGSSLYLIREDHRSDMQELSGAICRHGITHLFLPCIALKALAEYLISPPIRRLPVKTIVVAGEQLQLTYTIRQLLQENGITLINQYGPTEAHVVSSYTIEPTDNAVSARPPIGKPISNTGIYILDSQNHLLPLGVAGEICLTGAGVARGYLHNESLTAEKFTANPFGEGRMYRTGDSGRWLPDGNLEFLGRLDDQVKIRGYRIETGEVETVLLQSGLVREAVVLAKEDNDGAKRLIGYIVPVEAFEKEALLAYLGRWLPEYMVPAVWVEMETLPTTPTGKVDRKALPHPDVSDVLSESYAAPRNEVEATLCTIWQELLEVQKVGIHDNFFELGGHSLLAMRLISVIRRELQVEVMVKELFAYPTIATLSGYLHQVKRNLLPAIEVAASRPAHLPLSFSQERLWFIDQLEGSVQYHMPAVLRLKGFLNKEALAYALQQIIQRHEVLRTVIRQEEGQAYQSVLPSNGWHLTYVDGSEYKAAPESLPSYLQQLLQAPFELSRDYMLRAHLIRLQDRDHILVITLHHIASDGWSLSVLVREVTELYRAYAEGRDAALAVLPIQYADYTLWQRHYLQGELLEKKLRYWANKLQGVTPLNMPTDHPRPAMHSNRGAMASFSIKKELTSELQHLSHQQGATLFMTLLAVFKVLLYRYTGQEDICVGTPIAGREQQQVEHLIGFFVNTLTLRDEVNGELSFVALLQQVKHTTLDAYEHQQVPFEKVVEAVVKERDLSRSPLFQVMFVLQNTPAIPALQLGEVELTTEDHDRNIAKFELSFNITETAHGLQGELEYCTDLFEASTIKRLIEHYKRLLHAVVQQPQQRLRALPMLSAAEEQQLLLEFNNTEVNYPPPTTLVDLFERQVIKTPRRIALCLESRQLTYDELNAKANQLAHHLKKKGVKEEALLPICIERSMEMIIGILAILKAGATYVPIDPAYPLDRIHYMLQDTESTVVLTSTLSRSRLPEGENAEYIIIDKEWPLIAGQPTCNLQTRLSPAALVYVIYTSGSTGKPKGVEMPGSNLVNLLRWQEQQFNNAQRHVLQFASLNFDVSFQEIFSTLCFGSSLYLIREDHRSDMQELSGAICRHDITHLFIPCLVLKSLAEHIVTNRVDHLPLKTIIVAGEQLQLTKEIKELLNSGGITLINQYGPTEAHVVSSYTIEPTDNAVSARPPIGKPISNTGIYILDSQNHLLPLGVAGEICLTGAGVARGYLHNESLTAEKFTANPFGEGRMYRTGDSGRWLPDGNLEFLGRLDDQVKIRGYRIETGEVETVLLQSGLVREAMVLAKANPEGNRQLVGYVVVEQAFDRNAIIAFLETKLPAYMIPSLIIPLAALPVTKNGKVDKKALPAPESWIMDDYVVAGTELETALVNIWAEVLGIKQVGIHDNFFELGGHSLLVVKMVAKIKQVTGRKVPPASLFQHPTVEKYARFLLEKQMAEASNHIVPIKAGSGKMPLYIVCHIGVAPLSRFIPFAGLLDNEQPVYGIQLPEVQELDTDSISIENIAARYVADLLAHDPHGPYAFAGYSIGGLIAVEMAKQLQAKGKKVTLLCVFDTIVSTGELPGPSAWYNTTHRKMAHAFAKLKKLTLSLYYKIDNNLYLLKYDTKNTLEGKKKYLIHRLEKLLKLKPSTNKKAAAPRPSDEVYKISMATYKKYKLAPYDGNITLIRAKRRTTYVEDSMFLGWKPYAKSVRVLEAEGNHFTMFNPAHNRRLATLVQQCLDGCGSEP